MTFSRLSRLALLVLPLFVPSAAAADFRLSDPSSKIYYTLAAAAGDDVKLDKGVQVTGNLHSNKKVKVEKESRVQGDVSAVEKIENKGTITGLVTPQAAARPLPVLLTEAAARALANRVFEGEKVFANTTIDDIVFVHGKARLLGSVNGVGTIIATNDIEVEKVEPGTGAGLLQATTRLSLIAFQHVKVLENRSFRGALYAGSEVLLEKNVRFDGVLVGRHKVEIKEGCTVRFLSPDVSAPALTILSPAAGSFAASATPEVRASFADDLSGVDAASARLTLDGQDRTAGAQVSASGLTFTPPAPLPDGAHTATVTVRDQAGNQASASVSFTTDTVPPALAVTAPPATVTGDATPQIAVSYSDALTGVDLASLGISLDGAPLAGCTAGPAAATCEPPALATGSHTVSATVRDRAGNSATAAHAFNLILDADPPVVTITSPADGQTVTSSPVQVTGTVTDAGAIASVAVNGQPLSLSGNAFSAPVSLTNGSNTITVEATDAAGNVGRATVTVTLQSDTTPPTIAITSPSAGTFVLQFREKIDVTFSDESGVDTASLALTVNGAPLPADCQPAEGGARCTPLADLPEASVLLAASIRDLAGNTGSASIQVIVDTAALEVVLTSPENNLVTRDAEVSVTGTVPHGVVRVDVNGVPANLSGTSFSATVPLREGVNMMVALATKANGRTGASSIQVTRDLAPPIVRISTPRNGLVSPTNRVAVTGVVNDIVTGGVTPQVVVNGVEAGVMNGSFMLEGIELVPGPNTIEAVAADAVGNTGRHAITVTFQPLVGDRIAVGSGNGQFARVLETLPQPLIAVIRDDLGNPVAGRLVRFEVTRNSGTLRARAGDPPQRAIQVPTDGSGRSSALFTLGDTSGDGNNRVLATALGVAGEAEFGASALPNPAARIAMSMGDNQRGVVRQPLPMPLLAIVLDGDGNPVPGVDVTFTVVKGTGTLEGGPNVILRTDADGHARTTLTLGLEAGINNNVVAASFAGLTGLPATFTSSGVAPGNPADTRFSGVVLDNALTPIPGVEISIGGTSLVAVTDAQGQFEIANVPVGHIHIHIDAANATRPETFPPLAFETVTIAGQNNTLGQPILLPKMALENSKVVGGPQDVTLTMEGVAGLSLTVFANSATFPGGAKTGTLSISQVHLDKVPMAPPNGNLFMAPAWSIQPPGVQFDPPARITIPNNGLPPGRVVDIYQFDHHLNQFIKVGQGTVSEDGAVITADAGFGILAAGWGGGAPPPPPTTCTPSCAPPKQLECRTEAKQLVVISTRPCIFFCLPNNTNKPDGTPCTDDGDKCTKDICEGGDCEHPKIPELDGPGETRFCLTNPRCCLAAYNCMEPAFQFETSVTGRPPGYCDQGDAIRHTYWMCCISKSRGRDCAVGFGNAHEASGGDTEPCESHMQDFHNNSQGADLGQQGPPCEQIVLDALAAGKLQTSASCR